MESMFGLTRSGPYKSPAQPVKRSMMSTTDVITGYEVTDSLRVVEVALEQGFSKISIQNVGLVGGGGLSSLISDAKDALAMLAGEFDANAIIGLRYVIEGRELEKSIIAFGTAVKCRKTTPPDIMST